MKEDFEEDRLTKTYVYLGFSGVQEVELRGEYILEGYKIECDGLYFFFEENGVGRVMEDPHFETSPAEYFPYGWGVMEPEFAGLKHLTEELRTQTSTITWTDGTTTSFTPTWTIPFKYFNISLSEMSVQAIQGENKVLCSVLAVIPPGTAWGVEPITLSATVPSGAGFTISFGTNPVSVGGQSSTVIGDFTNAVAGTYTVEIKGSSCGIDSVQFLQVTVLSGGEGEAIQTGRDFLDGVGCATGNVLFTKLEERTPNFYWHDLAGLERPEIQGLRLCWVVRFEQEYRPGHFFEVWVDACTGDVVGGTQCK